MSVQLNKSQWQNADMNILATLDLIYSAAASITTASEAGFAPVEAQSDGHMHTTCKLSAALSGIREHVPQCFTGNMRAVFAQYTCSCVNIQR